MWEACGKWLDISKHAFEGMTQERPSITIEQLCLVLEKPDHDNGREARRRIGPRTIRVYYDEDDTQIRARGVSASKGRQR